MVGGVEREAVLFSRAWLRPHRGIGAIPRCEDGSNSECDATGGNWKEENGFGIANSACSHDYDGCKLRAR